MGYLWSSKTDPTDIRHVYRLAFENLSVYPSNGNDVRWYGFPLRCSSIDNNNVRSGNISLELGKLGAVGGGGYVRSSTAEHSTMVAYVLRYNQSAVSPSTYYNLSTAFPLRCSSIDGNNNRKRHQK